MKKKILFFSLIIACFVCVICFLSACNLDDTVTISISSQDELATYMAEGFKEKSDGKEVEKYIISNDITVTRTDIKNAATVAYENSILWGNTESDARKTFGAVKNAVIDGQNHTIKNLSLSGFRAGFLGGVTGNVTIKNLTFDNLTVDSIGETGGIVAYLKDSANITLENVNIINSSILGNEESSVGGFIGYSYRAKGTISGCSLENSTVNGESSVACGGFIGNSIGIRDEFISVSDSESIGNEINGKENVGGIIGIFKHESEDYNADRLIEFKNLTCGSKIIATSKRAGGILGFLSYWDFANFTFTNCKTEFNQSDDREILSSGNSAGGILGSAIWNGSAARVPNGSQINFVNCTNSIAISADGFVGGISGYIDNNFWNVTFTSCKNLSNGSIYGATKLGGISGSIEGCILGAQEFSFTNCENNAFVTGSGEYIGGISGYNAKLSPLFTNCKNSSQQNWLTGLKYVGGISARYGKFVGCENAMDIKHNGDVQASWQYVGGIVGSGEDSTFTNCSNSGNIIDYANSTGVSASFIGGIAGFTSKLVLNGCSNSGTVSGSECVGGLIGKSDATWLEGQKNTLINCSNTGNVYALGQSYTTEADFEDGNVAGKIGIVIGSFYTGTLTFEFSNITVSGDIYIINDTDYVGGWCGYLAEGDEQTLKSATEGLDFSYNIYFSGDVSDLCKSKIKFGENIFDDPAEGFNNPASTGSFTFIKQ